MTSTFLRLRGIWDIAWNRSVQPLGKKEAYLWRNIRVKYTEDYVIEVIEWLVNIIFVAYVWGFFKDAVGI